MTVDNLAPRIQNLVTRLSGGEEPGAGPATAPDRAAVEREYRQVLRRWFGLAAQGRNADREEVERVYQEILRLIDDVGEPRATALRRERVRAWWQETGACPYCGERGLHHDANVGGEPTGEGDPPRASK